eukprot:m.16658 g.16658  ORF g.16658 m.16658 type:complete len:522 (+) comp8034_c0_seq1:48-1613(+)
MSLHDLLLQDLEGLDSEDESDVEEGNEEGDNNTSRMSEGMDSMNTSRVGGDGSGNTNEDSDDDDDSDDDLEEAAAGDENEDDTKDRVGAIAKLVNSDNLQRILKGIAKYKEQPRKENVGSNDPEVELIVEANNITAEIDNEIGVVHKFIRDNYATRFPELEQLVRDPVDYVNTIRVLQNSLDSVQDRIQHLLPPATVMVVSVSASTSQGAEMSVEELDRVNEGCSMLLDLVQHKSAIYEYVESKMSFLAPNLTHICGSSTAARLLGVAGGLVKLSKMPACNVLLLGSQKKVMSGFSAAQTLPHTGFIFYSDIVQSQPPEYRKKCARMVAAKVTLAARVDAYRTTYSEGATVGIGFRADIEKKMEKAMEPPPAKTVKALARPDDPFKKRRGGRRFRKQREKMAKSEAAKAANRMTFGEVDEDVIQDEMGSANNKYSAKGRIRQLQTKQKGGTISKRMQKRLQQERITHGGMSTVRSSMHGTASVSFTPMQGLEIVSTNNAKKAKSSLKYFGSSVSYLNVKKK